MSSGDRHRQRFLTAAPVVHTYRSGWLDGCRSRERMKVLEGNKKKMRNYGRRIVADYHFEKRSITNPFVIALVLAAFAVMSTIQI